MIAVDEREQEIEVLRLEADAIRANPRGDDGGLSESQVTRLKSISGSIAYQRKLINRDRDPLDTSVKPMTDTGGTANIALGNATRRDINAAIFTILNALTDYDVTVEYDVEFIRGTISISWRPTSLLQSSD